MFKDMEISEDLMREYRQSRTTVMADTDEIEMDIHVSMLTPVNWPIQALSKMEKDSNGEGVFYQQGQLPTEVSIMAERYKQFHLRKHPRRRVTWHLGLGTAEVRAQFKARKHDLIVSVWGMIVLCCFNDTDSEGGWLTFDVLKEQTMIPDDELERTLQSLACAKYRILVKDPPGREVARTDRFQVNADFTAPLQRIRIPQIAKTRPGHLETNAEAKLTQARVKEERKQMCGLVIVRIMKARKKMSQSDLIAEVVKQLSGRFQVDVHMVKQRIEELTEDEYLQRSEGNRKMFEYVA